MQRIVKCEICGNEYIARQKNSRTCSPQCYRKLTYHERSRPDKKRTPRSTKEPKNTKKEKHKIETMSACKHRDCIYRSKFGSDVCCDYCLEAGKPRGCKISECDKYVSGRRKKQQIGVFSKNIMEGKDVYKNRSGNR